MKIEKNSITNSKKIEKCRFLSKDKKYIVLKNKNEEAEFYFFLVNNKIPTKKIDLYKIDAVNTEFKFIMPRKPTNVKLDKKEENRAKLLDQQSTYTLEEFKDLKISEVLEYCPTDIRAEKWITSVKNMVATNTKTIENQIKAKELINVRLINILFGSLGAMMTNLQLNGAISIYKKAEIDFKAGKSKEKIINNITDTISTYFNTFKKDMLDVQKHVEDIK